MQINHLEVVLGGGGGGGNKYNGVFAGPPYCTGQGDGKRAREETSHTRVAIKILARSGLFSLVVIFLRPPSVLPRDQIRWVRMRPPPATRLQEKPCRWTPARPD